MRSISMSLITHRLRDFNFKPKTTNPVIWAKKHGRPAASISFREDHERRIRWGTGAIITADDQVRPRPCGLLHSRVTDSIRPLSSSFSMKFGNTSQCHLVDRWTDSENLRTARIWRGVSLAAKQSFYVSGESGWAESSSDSSQRERESFFCGNLSRHFWKKIIIKFSVSVLPLLHTGASSVPPIGRRLFTWKDFSFFFKEKISIPHAAFVFCCCRETENRDTSTDPQSSKKFPPNQFHPSGQQPLPLDSTFIR